MKIIYLAHPIGAPTKEGIEANLADLRRIVRFINLNYHDVVPFVPYYADIVSMDDNIPTEREKGIKNDKSILESGIVNELWLTGDRISDGMIAEQHIAWIEMIPVIDMIGKIFVKIRAVSGFARSPP